MEEEEIKLTEDYPRWISDGEYRARCVEYSKLVPYKGTRKIFLTFELLTEPWAGVRLYMPLNIPWGGVRPGGKYFKYWTAANGDRPPSRNATMSPRIFKGKEFMVFTRTVKPKRGPRDMGMDFWYSVVDHIELLPDTKISERTRNN